MIFKLFMILIKLLKVELQKLIRKFKPRMFMKYRWLPLKRTLVLRLICFECNVESIVVSTGKYSD